VHVVSARGVQMQGRGGEGELGLASGRGMHTISDLGAGEGVQALGIRDIV
jgi:hypothetical protein